jgi:hypothetical protein
MNSGPTPYATDEDIAIRASSDYSILVPKDQKIAWGTDGQFKPGCRWDLSSAAVDFFACGLLPGHVVNLTQPVSAFRPPGEFLVVAQIGAGTVKLRRKGQAEGGGQPPAPPAGLSQVEFSVATFAPQIACASYDLNRRYGIDDLVAGRRTSDLFDPREVREAAVLTVLYRQYTDLCRGPEQYGDSFAAKAHLYKQELDYLLARTVVHWLPAPGGGPSGGPTSRFGTRLSR